MSSRFLPVFEKNATFVVVGTIPLVESHHVDYERMLALCTQYRRRGISRFLQRGQPELLQQDLQRSGAAFAAYLAWAADSDVLVSHALPFFDAAVCGDMQAAAAIAQQSPNDHKPDREYEDDALYMRIVMGRFGLASNRDVLTSLLRRYEAVIEGAEEPRFAICKAYLEEQPEAFETALEQLLTGREDHYSRGVQAETVVEEEWATEGRVFIEGLALVRFARNLGFPVQSDYLFLPSLAARSVAVSYDPLSWMSP